MKTALIDRESFCFRKTLQFRCLRPLIFQFRQKSGYFHFLAEFVFPIAFKGNAREVTRIRTKCANWFLNCRIQFSFNEMLPLKFYEEQIF